MKNRVLKLALAAIVVAGLGAYLEHRFDQANADTRIGMTDPRTVELEDAPIRSDWILEGPARATAKEIGRTHDGSTQLLVWRVSNGRFNWHYDFDESVMILDGDVYLTDGADAAPGNPKERHLGPGDVVFFHVGSVATWRVPDHVRKVATVKHRQPAAVATLARFYRSVKDLFAPPAKVL